MLLILVGVVCIALVVELGKWILPSFRKLFFRIFNPLLRPHEKRGAMTGATFYIISTLLCIFIFDKHIAIVCIFFIVLGDAAAALIGRKWGKIRLLGNKSLEGSIACFGICAIITLFWINPIVGITGAFVATLIELLPIPIDDNLTVPIISGAVMQLMVNYLPSCSLVC